MHQAYIESNEGSALIGVQILLVMYTVTHSYTSNFSHPSKMHKV